MTDFRHGHEGLHDLHLKERIQPESSGSNGCYDETLMARVWMEITKKVVLLDYNDSIWDRINPGAKESKQN